MTLRFVCPLCSKGVTLRVRPVEPPTCACRKGKVVTRMIYVEHPAPPGRMLGNSNGRSGATTPPGRDRAPNEEAPDMAQGTHRTRRAKALSS